MRTKRNWIWIVPAAMLIALLAAAHAVSNPRPADDVKTIHVPITGSTLGELRAALEELPAAGSDEHVTSSFSWNVAHDEQGRGCAVEDVAVGVDLTYYVPMWAAPPGEPRLQAWWDDYSERYQAHLDSHGRRASLAAERMERKLAALEPRPTCAALDAAAERVVATERRALAQRQHAFEARSRAALQLPAPPR